MKYLFLWSFILVQEDIETFSMEEIRLDEKIRCVICLRRDLYVFIYTELLF